MVSGGEFVLLPVLLEFELPPLLLFVLFPEVPEDDEPLLLPAPDIGTVSRWLSVMALLVQLFQLRKPST